MSENEENIPLAAFGGVNQSEYSNVYQREYDRAYTHYIVQEAFAGAEKEEAHAKAHRLAEIAARQKTDDYFKEEQQLGEHGQPDTSQ